MTNPIALVPSNLQGVLDREVQRLRAAGTDLQSVEVKKAAGGLPQTALESVCAFANAGGGLLILGLTEEGFTPVDINAPKLAADLASACSDGLEPAIRPEIDIAQVDNQPVVVARVDPLDYQRRPCHLKSKGMEGGTFRRTHDGDRRLNSYEVHVMVTGRGQPADDAERVEDSGLEHLDPELMDNLLRRLRTTRGPVFGRFSDEEVLNMMGVTVEPTADSAVTLAGLLALGNYPQQFFPQLGASFVVLPTSDGEPAADGTRFVDNRPLDGPIPTIVSTAVAAMLRNMRRRAVVVDAGREDVWEYPTEAVREVVANALMHRDYHSTAHGSQTRIRLYPDRFEVSSIGGLHGAGSGSTGVEDLIARSITATRNARLAKLLEDVVIPGTGRPVCENRGSGLRAAVAALRRAGMSPPRMIDRVNELRVVIDAPNWTSTSASTRRETDLETGDATTASPWDLSPRERQITELLSDGSRSSGELAGSMGISRQAVLNWLNLMADRGLVRPTARNRRSRLNRWELHPDP